MPTVYLCPSFGVGWQGEDEDGVPISGGLLYTYAAGSDTPLATYTTVAGSVANANPIVLESDGRPPSEIWLTDAAYKFTLKTSAGVLVKTWDNISGIISTNEADLTVETLTVTGTESVDKNNTEDAVTLVHPDSTSATWDSQPLAALRISRPPTATTRAFLCGLWVETEGATIDKGRGIIVSNYGASDGIYVQVQGDSGTGYAGYATSAADNAVVAVFSTDKAGQLALGLRQETSINPTAGGVLLSLQADGAITEMVQVGSSVGVGAQVGFVFRMFGSGATCMAGVNSGGTTLWKLNADGTMAHGNGSALAPSITFQTDPDLGLYRIGDNNLGVKASAGVSFSDSIHAYSATAAIAGGSAGAGVRLGAGNQGMYWGSGAPSLSAGQGALYLRTDGSSTSTRAYINTDGSTGWTAITTAT